MILAIEIVVTIIEFHIVTLVAFVTVPFGVLTQTSFMSERAIGYVVSVGIKLMALAIVVSLGTSVFNTYTVSAAPDINEDVGLLVGAVVMVMLALKIPAIAGALISGGPQLNAGGAVMGAAGVAAGVAGVALAGRIAGGAIAQGFAAGGQHVAAARAASGPASGGGAGGAPEDRAPPVLPEGRAVLARRLRRARQRRPSSPRAGALLRARPDPHRLRRAPMRPRKPPLRPIPPLSRPPPRRWRALGLGKAAGSHGRPAAPPPRPWRAAKAKARACRRRRPRRPRNPRHELQKVEPRC